MIHNNYVTPMSYHTNGNNLMTIQNQIHMINNNDNNCNNNM